MWKEEVHPFIRTTLQRTYGGRTNGMPSVEPCIRKHVVDFEMVVLEALGHELLSLQVLDEVMCFSASVSLVNVRSALLYVNHFRRQHDCSYICESVFFSLPESPCRLDRVAGRSGPVPVGRMYACYQILELSQPTKIKCIVVLHDLICVLVGGWIIKW